MTTFINDKEALVAGEAAKYSAEVTKKYEKEMSEKKKLILEEALRHPVIITVGEKEFILYEKDGKIEVVFAKKVLPAFRSVEELTEIISENEK